MTIHYFIAVLAIAGFYIARHIHDHKKKGKKLICPFRMSCDTVIGSSYSTLFGIPLELLGMGYYGLTAVLHVVVFFGIVPTPLYMLVIAGIAFLFSMYLVLVQAYKLHSWCSWCVGSAIISTVIFFLSFSIFF